MNGVATVQLVYLLLLLFIISFGLLARRLQTPYPIVMVIGGLVLSLIPGMPSVTLDPDLIFLVVLPPLLYSSAWTTSWRDFYYNLTSILMLAFGLVGFTIAGVALIGPYVFPGFDWRLGLLLGAIVAPTDAIAATSVARKVGLPSRIVDVLEGESLINDASGLLALEFATTIIVDRHIPTFQSGVLTLVWLMVGGIAVGLAIAYLVDWLERYIDDGPIEITLSIFVPYAVYLAANAVHASGVLAVVACGLLLSRKSVKFFSPTVRIQIWSVWASLTFVLNGFVFVVIGLQLPSITSSLRGMSVPNLLLYGATFSAILVALRLIWVFPGARVAFWIRIRLEKQRERIPHLRQIFVVGWTGMRGVVSLAAALALPATVADGSPFPQRSFIIFLTFCVIVVTLAIQGLTLPPLIRSLGLAGQKGPNCEEQEARRIATQSALEHLEQSKNRDAGGFAEIYDDLVGHYRQRLASIGRSAEQDESVGNQLRHIELSLEALRVERQAVIDLRDQGRINDEVLRRLEHELDLSESRLLVTTE